MSCLRHQPSLYPISLENTVILQLLILIIKIVTAFRGMHMSPAKHTQESVQHAFFKRMVNVRLTHMVNVKIE